MLLKSLVACAFLILAVSAQQTGEYVSREEFESLKEEFVGVKTELEKRDKEIQSLKRALLLDGLDDKLELLHYKLDEVQEDIRSFQPADQSQACDANTTTAPGLSPWYLPSSCKEIAELYQNHRSGYYWLATQHRGRAQVYCDYNLTSAQNPAHSCKQLAYRYPTATSGHYWVLNGSGVAVESYCDVKRRCCGSTGGWMRVAHLDMTDPNHYCPEGFRLFPGPKRLCTRDASGSGCTSIKFTTHGVLYSRVCGKVIGYQHEIPDAFSQYHGGQAGNIDEPYVDGVSITHGSPNRKHIWTFAGAADETRADSLIIGVLAQRQVLLSLEPYHHLLETITFVTPAVAMQQRTGSTMRMLCGMAKDVAQPAPAASSTLLPTSVKSSLRQPLMTLK